MRESLDIFSAPHGLPSIQAFRSTCVHKIGHDLPYTGLLQVWSGNGRVYMWMGCLYSPVGRWELK